MATIKIAASEIEGPFLVKVGTFDGGQKNLTVPTLKDASYAVKGFIWDDRVRSSDWHGGEVVRDDGTGDVVAVVSYNGRVWGAKAHPTDPWHVPDKALEFDLDA